LAEVLLESLVVCRNECRQQQKGKYGQKNYLIDENGKKHLINRWFAKTRHAALVLCQLGNIGRAILALLHGAGKQSEHGIAPAIDDSACEILRA